MKTIIDQGFEVLVNNKAGMFKTNGQGGDCIRISPASVPEGHRKYGRGPVVALSDTEDPEGREMIFTWKEVELFVSGVAGDEFASVKAEAELLASYEADLADASA